MYLWTNNFTMDKKKFGLWNGIASIVVFVISAFTYLSTIEPSASFWDCGEFIASSYKLEVGHPPGNPVFQLIARLFTCFTGGSPANPDAAGNLSAAVAVNVMSALMSALTIFFLYLTVVFFAKRLFKAKEDGTYSLGESIAIIGSGVVGALAYTFSDTFWFSAVEAEVYAMSSLVTAVVIWAMTKWYEQADTPYANRWIVLISFVMGLSIGIHLLNLLAIPALVFMFYYRKNEGGHFSFKKSLKIFLISVVILAVILFGIIPYLPLTAAYFDLFFVNVIGLPYNTGAAFFMVALLVACFWGIIKTAKTEKVFWNTVLLCFTTIVVGFSVFSIEIIRSSVKTPTNEYQPDNAFTLVRYLSREQYGKTPLVYGQYFAAPYDIKQSTYWAPLDGKYKSVDAPSEPDYRPEGKMFFPRMWNSDERAIRFYETYTKGKGKIVPGAEGGKPKPTFGTNMRFFFDYQLNWMYWRYFLWNFAGRQNEIHSPSPGDIFIGNWESGIPFIDNLILGDQSDAPSSLKDNKGKNHYFMLPLLLGLLGLFFQFERDKRGCWLNFLMFFMTGIAIVLYLNQAPYQVRERDYAYAGSFYFFALWIGLAVAAIFTIINDRLKGKGAAKVATAVSLLCCAVPALMAEENWDDHDRSNRYTAVEMARNYLNSVGPNGILVTHGDNDTFPLWYAQEVENCRQDVRIVNTSLLGTDWHIDQMKYACNKSTPLPLTVGMSQYLYGTNEWIFINDTRNQVVPLSDVMAVFKHPDAKVALTSGKKVDYIVSRKFSIPVNKDNVIQSGILPESMRDSIPDEIILSIPQGKSYVTKQELFFLDFLSNYQWDRPLNLLNQGGDINIGIKDYLMYEGYSYKFIPIRNVVSATDPGLVDVDHLYNLMTNVYKWDAISRTDYFADYQNMYTHMGVMSQRALFVQCAYAFLKAGHRDWALEMLDKCQSVFHEEMYPFDSIPTGFTTNDYMVVQMVSLYYALGEKEKAEAVATTFGNELLASARFYLEFYDYARSDFEMACNYIYFLSDELTKGGSKDIADKLSAALNTMLGGEQAAS